VVSDLKISKQNRNPLHRRFCDVTEKNIHSNRERERVDQSDSTNFTGFTHTDFD